MANKNRLYPHLLPVDIPVWERFLAEHRADYTRIDYDVRVGKGRDPGSEYDDNIRKMGIDLSMRRIDAVGYTPNFIHIIEITRVASLRAIGQLTSYPLLYEATYQPDRPLIPLLVAEQIGTDLIPVIHKQPFEVSLWPPAV